MSVWMMLDQVELLLARIDRTDETLMTRALLDMLAHLKRKENSNVYQLLPISAPIFQVIKAERTEIKKKI